MENPFEAVEFAPVPADRRKAGEYYREYYRRVYKGGVEVKVYGPHVYRVLAVHHGTDGIPSWYGGWGITVQHSYDGGQTFQAPVTHCTPFNPKYEKISG